MDTRDVLIALDIYCGHDWNTLCDIIHNKEIEMFDNESTMLRIEAEKYALLAKGYKIVVFVDLEYPKKIFNSIEPPFVIYYKGDLDTVADRYSYQTSSANPTRMFID